MLLACPLPRPLVMPVFAPPALDVLPATALAPPEFGFAPWAFVAGVLPLGVVVGGLPLVSGDAAVPLPFALAGAPGAGAAPVPPPWPATVPAPPISWPGAPAVDGAPLFDP